MIAAISDHVEGKQQDVLSGVDSAGNPVQTDSAGNPVQRDAAGNPVPAQATGQAAVIAATTIHEMIATLRRIEDRLAQVVGKLDIVIDALGSELEEQGEFDLEGNPTPGRKRDEGESLG